MKKKIMRVSFMIAASGFAMWFTGGLWHNLILPSFNENIHPHHEGLLITLIAYFILAGFMLYLLNWINPKEKLILNSLKLGMLIGIIWVFPHGLSLAAVHGTSLIYEVKNTLYHIFEQGIGGLVLGLIISKIQK